MHINIKEKEIKEIYQSHDLITSSHVQVESISPLTFLITLFKDESIITETSIKLKFQKNVKLYHPSPNYSCNGNLVEIEVFILAEKYRRKGIAKNIHKKEIVAYKKHNIQQMQLKAAYSGFFAWNRLGFSCRNEDTQKAKGTIIAYLIDKEEKSQEFFSDLANRDLSFLLEKIKDESENFLKWASTKEKETKIFMYKDIT